MYNVGKIKKDNLPSAARIVAGVGSKPIGKSSTVSITENSDLSTPDAENSQKTVSEKEVDVDAVVARMKELAEKAQSGAELTEAEQRDLALMNSELNAILSERALGNEHFIGRLVREDTNAAQRILNGISDMAEKLAVGKSKELKQSYKFLKTAEELYLSAVAESGWKYQNGRIMRGDEEEDGGVQNSFAGYAEDGKGKYVSNFPKGTPKAAKAARILHYIQNVWSKKPIILNITDADGKAQQIQAQFDPTYDETDGMKTDASKLMGGNRHGNASEQRVTLDLADDYYQIASESTYNYSKKETGKETPTHQDVKEWHYFVNDIYFAEHGEDNFEPYTVTINVKEKKEGGFVYSFSAEQSSSESNTRQTLHADVTEGKTLSNVTLATNNSISQNEDLSTPAAQNNSGVQESRKKRGTKGIDPEYTQLQDLYARAFVKADERAVWADRSEKSKDTIRYSVANDLSFHENLYQILNMSDEEAIRRKEQGYYVNISSETPRVILDHVDDAKNLGMIIRFDSLYLGARTDGVLKGNYHGLGYDVLSKLERYIADPLAIVMMNNGRCCVLAEFETKNKNGIISIEMNTVKDINNKNDKYHLIVTVFSAKDNYVKNMLMERGRKVVYKKDGLEQVNNQLHEWLATVNNNPPINSIRPNPPDVNTSDEKNSFAGREIEDVSIPEEEQER